MYKKLQDMLERWVGPLATKLGQNERIKALTSGMLSATLVTLGMAVFAIIGNFPIPAWTQFLKDMGLYDAMQGMISATSGILTIYMIIAIAYHNAKMEGESGIIAAILSLVSYMVLVPLHYIEVEGHMMSFISIDSLGSDGMFVGMILAMVISTLYAKLMKKNLKLKLPDSVPPMVTESLSPSLVAMIIFFIAFLLKVIFNFTQYGDIFNCVNTLIAEPFLNIGASPITAVIVYTIITLLWFFGLHPAVIINVYFTSISAVFITDVTAFIAGQPIPNLNFEVVCTALAIGGTGCTLGLAINMLRSKSEKFKALSKIGFIPNLFNINEPIIFGVPVMLNPIFFIPMISSSAVSGLIAYLFLKIDIVTYFDPTIVLPWVTPSFVAAFFNGGIMLGAMAITVIIAQCILYYPFFKIADKRALEEENQNSEA